METLDYAKLYANTIKNSKPEDLEEIDILFKDKYGYEAPTDEVEKTKPVQPTETDTDVQVNVSTSSSSGVSSNTTEVVEEKPAVVIPEVTKDPTKDLVPNKTWDIKQTNDYNMIANTRARIVDLRNEGNNSKANSYGYDLRQMENRYKNTYNTELPEEMVPYKSPYEAQIKQEVLLPKGFEQLAPRGSQTFESLETTEIVSPDGNKDFIIDWDVDNGERTGSGRLRFGDNSISFDSNTDLNQLVKAARTTKGFPTDSARIDASTTISGKADTKGKELEIKYNKKMDELFNSSPAIQRFKKVFDKTVEPMMEKEVQRLFAKYPDASTNPDKLKLLQDDLQKYYSILWKKAASNSSAIADEEERITNLVQSEHAAEYESYVSSLDPEAKAKWDNHWLNQGLDVLNRGKGVITAMNPVAGILNKLANSKIGDQIRQSFVFSSKNIKSSTTAQKITFDANQVKKQLNALKSQFNAGDITKPEYDKRFKTYNRKLGILVADKIDELNKIDNDEFIKSSITHVVDDIDDPNFNTAENWALIVADQAFNLGLGVVPELLKRVPYGGPALSKVASAVALVAYAQQEYGEIEESSMRAALGRKFDRPEESFTNEEIAKFAISPEGIKVSKDAALLAGQSASFSVAIDKTLFGLGGVVKAAKVTKKVLSSLNKLKYLRRLKQLKLFKAGTATLFASGAVGLEALEEVYQLATVDYAAERQRQPNNNFITNSGNVIRNADKKAYKTAAIMGAIGSTGTSGISLAANLGKITFDPSSSLPNLNKIAQLSQEDLENFIEISKADFSAVYNNELRPDIERKNAKEHLIKLLDLEKANNELKVFPSIQGKARTKTLKLLTERARLDRFQKNATSTGLNANNKERMKVIDEQLATIERRAKRGYQSTFLEKVRSKIGPSRSIGASRKATFGQNVVDKIDEHLRAGISLPSVTDKARGILESLGLRDQNLEQTNAVLNEELANFDKSVFTTFSAYIESQEDNSTSFQQGKSSEDIVQASYKAEKANRPNIPVSIVPSTGPIDSVKQKEVVAAYHSNGLRVPQSVSSRFEDSYIAPLHLREEGQAAPGEAVSSKTRIEQLLNATKGDKASLALLSEVQKTKTEELASRFEGKKDQTRNQRDFKNEGWLNARSKSDVRNAESELKQGALMNPSKEITGSIIDALQDFVNVKYALDGIVFQYMEEAGSGVWNNKMQQGLEKSAAIDAATDKKTKKILDIELATIVRELKGIYNRGLGEIENQIAQKSADTNEYPDYFVAQKGLFVLEFKNKFGNSIIEDAFGDRGDAIFNALSIKDWTNLMVTFNRWQHNPTDGNKLKFRKKIGQFFNTYRDALPTEIKVDKEAERKQRAKSYGLIKTKLDPSLLPEEETEKEVKVYTEAEKNTSIIRWDTLSKDDKTLYEGNLLYMGIVGEMTAQDKQFKLMLDRYVEVVGHVEAKAFIQNLSRVEFTRPDVDVTTKGGEAIAKVSLLRQLWFDQVFGTFETDEEATSFIKTLPGSQGNLEISAVRQRLADIKNEITTIPDGPHKSDKRVQLTELTERLVELEAQQKVAQNLPTVETMIPTDVTLKFSDANIISFAGSILRGDQNPKTTEDKRWLSPSGLKRKITAEELRQHASIVTAVSKDVSQLVEQMRHKAGEARTLGITPDLGVGLSQEQVSQIDDINDKIGQLQGKRLAATEVLLDSARYIVGAELGIVFVDGFKGPNFDYNVENKEIGPGLPEVTSASLDKEIAAFEKERAETVKTLNSLENTIENKNKIGAAENHISMIDFFMNARKSLKKLGSITADVTSKVPLAKDVVTEKEKTERKRKQVNGLKAIDVVYGAINKMKDQMTSQIGKVIIPVSVSDIMQSMSYALYELDASKETVTSKFIENIASTLPIEFEDTLDPQQILDNRKATQYAASAVLSMMEEIGMIKQTPPKFFKDYYKVYVANNPLVTAFQSGIATAEADPDSEIGKRIPRNKEARNQISTTGIAVWEKFKHKTGLKAVKKMGPVEQEIMNNTPRVWNMLNDASAVVMSTNRELDNIVEHMINIEHPALNFTNKDFEKEAVKGYIRERDAIRTKAKANAGKGFQYNYTLGSRGRLHASASGLNHQASKHAKATIRFHKKVAMGNDGWGWLLADAAEAFGAKVNSLDDLQKYTFENINEWIKWVQNPIKYADNIFGDSDGKGGVDEPFQFIDSIIEIKNALAHGNPATYPSNYSSYLDQSVSGVLILGGLLGASEEMGYVNGMPGMTKRDLYAIVFKGLVEDDTIILNPSEDQLIIYKEVKDTLDEFDQESSEAWSQEGSVLVRKPKSIKDMSPVEYVKYKKDLFKKEMKEKGYWDIYNGVTWGEKLLVDMGRKMSKGPVMTKNYNAVVSGMAKAIYELLSVERHVDMSRENSYWLADQLDQGADKLLPNIRNLRAELKAVIEKKIATPGEDQDFGFTLPESGFPFKRRYREPETYDLGHKYKGNIDAKLDEVLFDKDVIQLKMAVGDSLRIDESDMLSGVVANFTHTFDKEILARLFNIINYEMLTVHDSVGVHLANVTDVFEKSRQAFNDVVNPQAFEDALAQTVGREEAKAIRKRVAPEDYNNEFMFQNQHNNGKSGKFDADNALKDIWERVGGVPENSLAERTDGIVTAETRGDRLVFQNSELDEVLTQTDELAETITQDTTDRMKDLGRLGLRIDDLIESIFAIDKEDGPDPVLKPYGLAAGINVLTKEFMRLDTTYGNIEHAELQYAILKETFDILEELGSPRLDKTMNQIRSSFDDWHLDVLTRTDEVNDIDNYTDPIEDALASFTKYPDTPVEPDEEDEFFGFDSEEELWANNDLDDLWGTWYDAKDDSYFGTFDIKATEIGSSELTNEIKLIRDLIKGNIEVYGAVEMELGDKNRLKELWKDDERELPSGFYNRHGIEGRKVPFIFTHAKGDAVETLIHEANHRLNEVLQQQFPDIWVNISEFVVSQGEFKAWVKREVTEKGAYYQNLEGDVPRQIDEFLSQVTGPQGAMLLNALERENKGTIAKLLDFFKQILSKIKSVLAISKEPRTIRDLTQLNLAVLLAGERIETAYKYYTDEAQNNRKLDRDYSIYDERVESLIRFGIKRGLTESQAMLDLLKTFPNMFIQEDVKASFSTRPTVSRSKVLNQQAELDDVIPTISHSAVPTSEGVTLSERLTNARYELSKTKGDKALAIKEFFNMLYDIPVEERNRALYESYTPSERIIVDSLRKKPTFVVSSPISGLPTSLLVSKTKELAKETILAFEINTDELVYIGFKGEYEAILPPEALATSRTVHETNSFKSVDEQIEDVSKQDKKCL